jgi:hypothetical protein
VSRAPQLDLQRRRGGATGPPVLVLSGAEAQSHSCIVTNVGTSPAEVSIELFDFDGRKLVPESGQCDAFSPLPPHASCSVQAADLEDVSCAIRSSSKNVRASLQVFDSDGNVVEVVPATSR